MSEALRVMGLSESRQFAQYHQVLNRAVWSPLGQQIMIPTPRQPYKRYGLGAVNDHTGETVVIFRQRKRRQEVAQVLQAILDRHPHETV